jgi:hypothetical protein
LKRSFIKLNAIRYLAEYFCDPNNTTKASDIKCLKKNVCIENTKHVQITEIEMQIIQIEDRLDDSTQMNNNNHKTKKDSDLIVGNKSISENKVSAFYNKKKSAVLYFDNNETQKRERLLSNYSLEDSERQIDQRKSFVELEDVNESRIPVPKLSILRNGQIVKVEHKYSFCFIGTYYIKIDLDGIII